MRDANFTPKVVDTFPEIICLIMTKLCAILEFFIFITQVIVFLAEVLNFTFTIVKHNFNNIFNCFPIFRQKKRKYVCIHSVYQCSRGLHYTVEGYTTLAVLERSARYGYRQEAPGAGNDRGKAY